MVFEEVTNFVLKKKDMAPRPLLIGVSGIDAAGKSTFVNRWSDYLIKQGHQVFTIHLDDFHNAKCIRRGQGEAAYECYYKYTFDFAKLRDKVLLPLHTSGSIDTELSLLDLETDQFNVTKHYNITTNAIVLVEGVFLFKELLYHLFDVTVFLDISFDECLRRVVKRDTYLFGDSERVKQRYINKYIPGQQVYLTNDRPIDKADILIDNNLLSKPILIRPRAQS